MLKKIYLLLIGICCGYIVAAQSPTIQLTVTPNPVSINEYCQLSYTISGNNIEQFDPSLNGLDAFQNKQRIGQSSSTSIINGKVSKSITYTYIMGTDIPGKYTIPSAKAKIDGKWYQSNSVELNVIAKNNNNTSNSSHNQKRNNTNSTPESNSNSDIFIKATTNKNKAYVGEELIVTYKLYTLVEIAQLAFKTAPSNKGFWSKDLTKDNENFKQYEEIVNGKRYMVAELKKQSYIPQQSGKLNIQPIELECIVRQKVKGGRSPFEDFFGDDPFFARYQNVKKTLKSNTISIIATPLPIKNKPIDFSGAVGNFSLTSNVDKLNLNVNDAISLKININGSGNIQLIPTPSLNFPPDFESYDPKNTENIKYSDNGIYGKRSFEYVLIARSPGKFTIPSYQFSYFDTKSGIYKTLKTPEYQITVNKGNLTTQTTTVIAGNKKDITYINSDIRFINDKDYELENKNHLFFNSYIFWILCISPFFLLIMFIIFKNKQIKQNQNITLVKNKKAQKLAKKRLSEAERHIKNENPNEFYIALSKAIWGFLSDKFNIPLSQLSIEKVTELTNLLKIDEVMVQQIQNLLDEIEYARFSPSNNNEKINELYQLGLKLIIDIEKTTKK